LSKRKTREKEELIKKVIEDESYNFIFLLIKKLIISNEKSF